MADRKDLAAALLNQTPGYKYGTILPMAYNPTTGDRKIAMPGLLAELLNSPVKMGQMAKGDRAIDPGEVFQASMDFSPAGLLSKAPVGALASGSVRRAANDLPMDEASRMARAREMGFDVDTPLYHGTTHDFQRFGGSTGNVEGHFGAGHYFTSSPKDASANYAGTGPDLTRRVELRAERLADEVLDVRGVDPEVAERYAKWRAGKELKGPHEGAVMPVYLRGRTVDVSPHTRGRPTTLENRYPEGSSVDDQMAMARKELGPDADEDDVYERALEAAEEVFASAEPEGELADFLNSIRDSSYEYDFDADEVFGVLPEEVYSGAVSANDLDRAMRGSSLMYAQHPETGDIATNDIIRQAFHAAGFDNIVMDAKTAFPSMPNIPEGTRHVITSNPKNIRSRFAAFDPAKSDSADLLASKTPPIAGLLSQKDREKREGLAGLLADGVRRGMAGEVF